MRDDDIDPTLLAILETLRGDGYVTSWTQMVTGRVMAWSFQLLSHVTFALQGDVLAVVSDLPSCEAQFRLDEPTSLDRLQAWLLAGRGRAA